MADHKRMTLVNDEFLSEHGGRLPAGSAVAVPEDVAERWEARGIATPSKKSDLTAREARKRLLEAELAALEAGPTYDAAITADGSSAAERRRRLLEGPSDTAVADEDDEDEKPKPKVPAQTLGTPSSQADDGKAAKK